MVMPLRLGPPASRASALLRMSTSSTEGSASRACRRDELWVSGANEGQLYRGERMATSGTEGLASRACKIELKTRRMVESG